MNNKRYDYGRPDIDMNGLAICEGTWYAAVLRIVFDGED